MLYGRMAEHEAQRAALNTLAELRFGDNDYFWVVDYQGHFVMHPIAPELEGQTIDAFDYRENVPLSLKIPRVLQQANGGLLYYHWPKPGHTQAAEKISYLEGFKPWGWAVGTGVYIDDVNRLLWEEVNNLLIVGVVLILILIIFWYGFQHSIFKK